MASRLKNISFKVYGRSFTNVALGDLLAHQETNGDLWANAENSGCEGIYCEIARWNDRAHRFERFAFSKFFGGEVAGKRNADARASAEHVANLINEKIKDRLLVVYVMPNFEGEPIAKLAAV